MCWRLYNNSSTKLSDLYILRSEIVSSHREEIESGTDVIATHNEITDWIDAPYATAVVNNTDHIATVHSCDEKYATTTALSNFQAEVSTNTTAIATIQEELVALGIGQIVNDLFSFIDNIVSDAALSAQIAKCFKLSGSPTLTGNITSGSGDRYLFMVPNHLKLLT